jgi:hypothetical protein
MIISIRDDFNKFEGTGLPMFSRSGRFTNNQFLCFNTKTKNPKEEAHIEEMDEDDDEVGQGDLEMIMGEKPLDIA